MRSILLVPALLLAVPAAAQSVIVPGQSVTGALSAADPTLDDGSRYDVWRFQGQANHRYRVTLHSDDFDAFLTVGADIQPGCDDCATDDDGGGGTDAQVEYTGSADGTYEIRANSFGDGESGRYELTLEDAGLVDEGEGHDHGDDAAPMGTPIGLDEAVSGELAAGDRKVDGLMYNDTYTYPGRAGETIRVTLRSADFNTVVTVGAYEVGECTELGADDDGGGGTDSRLTMTLAEDGAFHIHVTSAEAGETGRYTLLVERGDPAEAAGGMASELLAATTLTADTVAADAEPIRLGYSITGDLDEGDRQSFADSAYVDLYVYRARAGESVTIELMSDDFDAEVRVGRWVEGGWQPLGSDDDGGEGTNSLLTITFPEDGDYEIHARSLYAGQTGRYHVSVARS
jgi:hypothetical protein